MTVLREPDIDFSEVDDEDQSDYLAKLPVIGFAALGATPEVTFAEDDLPVDNLSNSLTYLRWATNNVSDDCFIDVFDLDTDVGVNYVGFAVHDFEGMSITVYGIPSDSPNDPVTLFAEQEIPNNDPLILEFQATYDFDHIRVKISGNNAGQDSRTAAIMHAGRLLRLSRGVKPDADNPVIVRNKKVDSLQGFSESGHYLGRMVRNEIKESKYEFANVEDGDVQAGGSVSLSFFLDQIVEYLPFFIAWAPDDYQHDVGYVWTTDAVAAVQNPITRRWSFTLNVRGYAAPGA